MFFSRVMVIGALVAGIVAAAAISAAMLLGQSWLHGDQIAYVAYLNFNPDIFLVDVDHGLIYNLTHNQAYDGDPAWSPDGRWLAFTSDRDGERAIYVMDRLGGSVRRLTDPDGVFGAPSWSADGERLYFPSLREGRNSFYSINFDGSDLHSLMNPDNPFTPITLDLALEPSEISLSRAPNGNMVAFMAYRDDQWGIYVSQNAGRSDARLLVDVGRFTEAPVWSPGSTKLAYVAYQNRTTDLYVIDVSTPNQPHRLTLTRTFVSSPAWRPQLN